jgi:hypothetical protein
VRRWYDADRKIESDLLFSDNIINNVSSSRHGLAPKTPNDATKYLDGTGAWSVPSGVPTGAVLAFGVATAPAGYLLCDGAAVSRTTFAALSHSSAPPTARAMARPLSMFPTYAVARRLALALTQT